MDKRLTELKTLVKFSEALGVQPDAEVVSEIKEIERRQILESIKAKTKKVELITEVTEEIQEVTEPESDPEEHANLVSEVLSILSKKTQLNEEVSVDSRIKNIERFLANASYGSYGSGEVRFKNLDDVDRYSVGNTDHVLRYNPDDKMFYFGYLSGDQGKVNSLTFEDTGPQVDPIPRMIAWNHNEDCLDVYQNDGSTCQVGLENYIEVYNGTANPIPHGTVVRFAGVYGFNGWIKPSVDLFVADSNAIPEYIIGVLTTNLEPGQTGRATTLGKVRELNTTGSTVGEVWQVGDILYAHPSIPGELTRNKPTAPNVAGGNVFINNGITKI
jgi:hypothetical protein